MNIDRTKIIIAAYPDHMVNSQLWLWIRLNLKQENIVTKAHRPYICARNLNVKEEVMPFLDDFDEFLFIDNDMVPSDYTAPFLTADADVVGSRFSGAPDGAFCDPTSFHLSFFRAKSAVFRKIEPPWFHFKYNKDGTKLTHCSCMYFGDKVRAAGFSVVQAGVATHPSRDSTWCGGG